MHVHAQVQATDSFQSLAIVVESSRAVEDPTGQRTGGRPTEVRLDPSTAITIDSDRGPCSGEHKTIHCSALYMCVRLSQDSSPLSSLIEGDSGTTGSEL